MLTDAILSELPNFNAKFVASERRKEWLIKTKTKENNNKIIAAFNKKRVPIFEKISSLLFLFTIEYTFIPSFKSLDFSKPVEVNILWFKETLKSFEESSILRCNG